MRPTLRRTVLACSVAGALALTACGGGSDDPLKADGGASGSNSDTNTIVVGAADFTESQILGEIYTQVLTINGFTSSLTGNLGSRDVYVPALKDGSIDVIPEYAGNLLTYLVPDTTSTALADVERDLPAALGDQLLTYTPAAATDTDSLTVTRETATEWNLTSIEDLLPHAAELTVAAPAEFALRQTGLVGLKEKYGLEVSEANFKPLASGKPILDALAKGDVRAANVFTSSPEISANDWVTLTDPKSVFPAGNVLPLVSAAKASDKLETVLDAISAKLTTEGLIELNDKVTGSSKTEPADAAKEWIAANGLDQAVG